MHQAVFVRALRTPMDAYHDSLSRTRSDVLVALILNGLQQRSDIEPALVDGIIPGCTSVRRITTLVHKFNYRQKERPNRVMYWTRSASASSKTQNG